MGGGPATSTIRHRIGSSVIDVSLPGERLALIEAIAHLRIDDPTVATPDLDVEVRFAPHPDWLRAIDYQGHLVVDDEEVGLHLGHDGALALFDRSTMRALWWFDTDAVARWHLAAPLRQILHWNCTIRGQALLHAAAVSHEGRAAPITGPGGTGKSTTSLLCHRDGLGFLGDDYCVVEPRDDGVDVHGLYRTAKLTELSQTFVPSALAHPHLDVDQHKRAVYLPDALTGPVPADVLLIARVDTNGPTHRVPATRMQALAAAGPTSVLQQRGSASRVLATLAAAVKNLPAEHLIVSDDVDQVAHQVRMALADHRR